MGIVLAFRGLAYSFLTNSGFGVVKCIAVDRSSCIPIGTCRSTVYFTAAFVREMKSCDTRGDDARSVLADAGRSEVCHVTVQALRAAMGGFVDTGIVIKTFVARAGTDDTLAILAICIVRALRVTFAAVL